MGSLGLQPNLNVRTLAVTMTMHLLEYDYGECRHEKNVMNLSGKENKYVS